MPEIMLTDLKVKLAAKKEIYLAVRVTTNAAKTELREIMADEALKISIAAVPEKGKANQELIKFLAREFSVSKNQVLLISGASERTKLIKISL
jgi:uncharacterized protein (TIGR00251 family)